MLTPQLAGETDASGRFQFEISTTDTLTRNQPVTLSVSLVDPAGQQESSSAEVMLALSAVNVEVFAEHQPVTVGVNNRILMLVSDPLGRPLVADVNLRGLDDVTTR